MRAGFVPLAVPPSPNVQAWDTIDPSESVDAVPSTATDDPLGVAVNDAVGASLETPSPSCRSA